MSQNLVLASRPARRVLLRRRTPDRRIEERAAEVLFQRLEHPRQVAVRNGGAGIRFVELQRMTTGTVRFHPYRHHEAPARIGLMAVIARELLPALRRVDALGVEVHFMRKEEIRFLAGGLALLRRDGNRPPVEFIVRFDRREYV